MDTNNSRPLYTLLIVTYKQEQFIREAIQSAFAQTYSPLEIVISDDHSPDRTWEIVQETVAEYHGPHKVVITQTPQNAGLCGNLNHAAKLIHGEWFFCCAGDDVSLPDRVEKFAEIIAKYPDVRGICSNHVAIDENGEILQNYKQQNEFRMIPRFDPTHKYGKTYCLLGCSSAYHRSIFFNYPPLPEKAIADDIIMTFRAHLEGSLCILPDVLLKYRVRKEALSFIASTQKGMSLEQKIEKTELGRKYYWLSVATFQESIAAAMTAAPQEQRRCYLWQMRYYQRWAEQIKNLSEWSKCSFPTRISTFFNLLLLRKKDAFKALRFLFGYRIGRL